MASLSLSGCPVTRRAAGKQGHTAGKGHRGGQGSIALAAGHTLRRAEHAENEIKCHTDAEKVRKARATAKENPTVLSRGTFSDVSKVSTFGQRRSRDALMSAFFSESALNR